MPKCPFCNMDKSKLENTILDETQNFYVVPALGSLVDGYILIISKRHINSMSELTIEEMNEYENLINQYRKTFKSIYTKYPIVFEHGAPNIDNDIKANSVLHAHTHIVNHHYKNEKYLIKKMKFKRISKIIDMNKSKKNYIFYIDSNNKIYITNIFKPIRQIMRIEVANDINIPYEYDWCQSRFEDNIILTINKIKNYKVKGSDNMDNRQNTTINWYPGHMAKAKRLIEEDLKLIDVVIEVIDARIPISSRNPDLNKMVKGKKKIIILNKSDLADDIQTKKWQGYLTQNDTIAISSNSLNTNKNNEIINTIEKIMKEEKEKSLEKGRVGRIVRVLILGIPNVR